METRCQRLGRGAERQVTLAEDPAAHDHRRIVDRLENWSRVQRKGGSRGRAIGSAEGRYVADNFNLRVPKTTLLDENDADAIERAWCGLLLFDKDVLRLHYVLRMDSRVICRKLRLPFGRSGVFNMALSHAHQEMIRALDRMPRVRRVQLGGSGVHNQKTDQARRVRVNIEDLCKAIKTQADIRNLPGYLRRVNPAEVRLNRIIWPYSLKSEIQCSLTNCGAHHKYGVIVELENGAITNVGHICGGDEDKFSTKFAQEMMRLGERGRRDAMMPVLLDRVGLERIERQIHAAYNLAQPWLERKATFTRMFVSVIEQVVRRIRAGESMDVTEVVERSSKEIDELVAAGTVNSRAEARYNEVRLGVVQGTAILKLLGPDLEKMWRRCDALLAANPLEATMSEIQNLHSDVYNLPILAREVIASCEAGGLFFSAANFETLSHLPMPDADRAALRALTLDKLDSYAQKKPVQPSSTESPRQLSEKQRKHYRRAGLIPPG